MPEQRARTYHRGRVVNTFAEEIIAPCHVTEVVLAPGGKSCRVFIAVTGNEQEEAETLDGLMAARAYIRTEIRQRMNVRHVPEITFAIDRSEKLGSRLDEILGRIERHRSKLATKASRPASTE
jgi:ribosome-binding factor A